MMSFGNDCNGVRHTLSVTGVVKDWELGYGVLEGCNTFRVYTTTYSYFCLCYLHAVPAMGLRIDGPSSVLIGTDFSLTCNARGNFPLTVSGERES